MPRGAERYREAMTLTTEKPLEVVLALLGQRGVYALLRALTAGPLRFGALQQISALPPRTLSLRLKELEEAGLIHRTEYSEVPPRVEYTLTEMGRALKPALEALAGWEQDLIAQPRSRP